MQPSVSIVIPVYNAEVTLGRCLESLLANAYVDYEIVLINDGSTDDSKDVADVYVQKYPDRIKVLDQNNQGVAKARNVGFGLARGEFVIFVDNDDFVDPDYLATFMSAIRESGADMVLGGYRRVTEAKTLYTLRLEETEWSRYMIMAPWAKIYRKDFLTKNGIEFLDNNIGEDVYFNLQAIHVTDRIKIIPYIGYNWYYNEHSVSNTKQKTLKSGLQVERLLNAGFDRLKAMGKIENEFVEFYFIRYIVWYLLFIGRDSEARSMIAEVDRYFRWLKEKFPNFQQNRSISLFRPQGETWRNRLAVVGFLALHRLHLLATFFRWYSRGSSV